MMMNAYLKPEYIEKNQAAGKLIGVWYVKSLVEDESTLYDEMFGKTGKRVDVFYSDYHKNAMVARDKIQGAV